MRGFVQFLTELILALTGALAAGAFVVGGTVFLLGCAACGGTWWWRSRRRQRADKAKARLR